MGNKNTRRGPLVGHLQAPTAIVGGWEIPSAGENDGDTSATGLKMVDLSHRSKIMVEGETAGEVVSSWGGIRELNPGFGESIGDDRYVYRLRLDQFFVDGPPGLDHELLKEIEQAATRAAGLVTVSNVTDGRSMVGLFGDQARECLSRVCGLDFSDRAFPNHAAKRSSVAKTRQLIVRRDRGDEVGFLICGGRSLAVYLWQTIERFIS